MTGADLHILERTDGEPGIELLGVARDGSGREAAIYLEPAEAMTAADQMTRLAEKWMSDTHG